MRNSFGHMSGLECLARFVHPYKCGLRFHEEENTVHQTHRKAAEQHELAARSHRTAAEHNEKGDNAGGRWHAERALEYSNLAYKLAKQAQPKSGQMETL